jgi:tRNA modification GTPase
MQRSQNDVIAAIATPPGRGGIGIVRISGPALIPFYRAITRSEERDPVARHAHVANFCAASGIAIDAGLALFFPAPHSFTGEDVVELHGHGGPVVMQLLLQRCLELGARAAEPGEFTRRAYLNGRIDLAQAESVADLIDAATAAAARSAMRSLSGEFSGRVNAMVDELTALRALTEATLDFPEEEVDFLRAAAADTRLQQLRDALAEVLATAKQGALLRDGVRVVITGAPNVGKSSIINMLSKKEVAIVTAIPGTTRDAIRQEIQLDGVPVHVVDTAGLRATADEVERLGIERTKQEAALADVLIDVVDASQKTGNPMALAADPGARRIRVRNKIDLVAEKPSLERRAEDWQVALSAKTGTGVELLRQAILEAAGWQGADEGLFLARQRHLSALRTAQGHLERAAGLSHALELFAEELRQAQDALGDVTGRVTPDALLGQIFSRFCIGK